MNNKDYRAWYEDELNEKIKGLEEENKMLHEGQGRLHRLWSKDTKHIAELEEENKKLRAYVDDLDSENDNQAIEIEELKKENRKLKEIIKDHQLYEKKLEQRIIEFEELLHGE